MTKASDILLEAPEEKHIVGAFVLGSGDERRYCAVGYLRCKGGLYEGKDFEEAYEAVGFKDRYKLVKHPIRNKTDSIIGIIIDLNDNHGWTFAQIGQWLKELGY